MLHFLSGLSTRPSPLREGGEDRSDSSAGAVLFLSLCVSVFQSCPLSPAYSFCLAPSGSSFGRLLILPTLSPSRPYLLLAPPACTSFSLSFRYVSAPLYKYVAAPAFKTGVTALVFKSIDTRVASLVTAGPASRKERRPALHTYREREIRIPLMTQCTQAVCMHRDISACVGCLCGRTSTQTFRSRRLAWTSRQCRRW